MSDSADAAAFWAERLGCARRALESPGLTLVLHPLPDRLYVMRVGEAVVCAAPESLHARLRAVTRPADLVTPEVLVPLVPEGSRLVGPARIAYLHRALAMPDGVERIESASDAGLGRLRAGVDAEEWQHANLDAAEPPIFACLERGEIAAAAGFERVGGKVAHIGVLTAPSHRGRGLGRRAVQATAAQARAAGLLTQYQTLASNVPALRIAESLGFEPFAVTLAARLPALTSEDP